MICDVCNSPTNAEVGTGYTAGEFRRLVSMGFEPDNNVIQMYQAMGITRAEAIGQWKNVLVAGSSTGWLLCPKCAARASRYMYKPTGSGMEELGATESWNSVVAAAATQSAPQPTFQEPPPPSTPPPPFIPSASVKTEARLHGFARGWTIFVIVYCSAVIATILPSVSSSSGYGHLLVPPLLCIVTMIVGLAKILKGKAHGLWIMIAASVGLILLNGSVSGNVTVITGGGILFVFLTWIFTRKQINYGRKQEN